MMVLVFVKGRARSGSPRFIPETHFASVQGGSLYTDDGKPGLLVDDKRKQLQSRLHVAGFALR